MTAVSIDVTAAATAAVEAATARLVSSFSRDSRIATGAELMAAIHENDAASLAILRPALEAACPDAGWADDEEGGGALPPGEWWVTDPVEGNVNHIHGRYGWGVSAVLVRDNEPVLAVASVVEGAGDPQTYAVTAGGGAWLGAQRLRVSAKTELRASLVGTGQARPGEDAATTRLLGRSVTAMLDAALLVQATVPATFPLLEVASGRSEGFWQFSQVRSGLLAGALFVREAGGFVTDVRGKPWTADSADFLAAAPGIADAASAVLTAVATDGEVAR